MWRIIPAMLAVGYLIVYDSTHSLSKPWRLALFAACTVLTLLCAHAVYVAPAR